MRRSKRALPALIAASALVLSGCASTSGELTLTVPDVPMKAELGTFEGELNIVNWSGFVDPKWVDPFTTETGCVVNSRVAGTSGGMVTVMRAGG